MIPHVKYKQVLAEVAKVAEAAGRDPRAITLVAVTKSRTPEEVMALYDQGCRDFGENRVAEAFEKMRQLPQDIRWHMIGTLQRKKVPGLAGAFHCIHSVDTLELAEKLHNCAVGTPVLLQVNCSGEESKHGYTGDVWERHLPRLRELEHPEVIGLMTMAPDTSDEAVIRKCFRTLRGLKERWGFHHLSMGMSNDYRIAIQEGATMLRIGSALFGP